MAQPTAYNQATDFSEEEVAGVAGRSTVRTPALDAEFSALETTIAQIRANLSALQRDDLELIDGAVELHTLSAEVLILIGSVGFTVNDPIGWVTAKEYAARSIVKEGTGTYVCAVSHTSGTFATDLAAGKWVAIFDSSSYVSSAIAFTPTGGVAATNVQAAIAEVDSEAPKKAQNLADVASVATARSNLSVPSKAEIQNQTFVYFADTGTADAMVATPAPAWAAYATGQRVSVKKAGVANATTTPTLNVSGLGTKVIFKSGGIAVAVGDLAANGHYEFQYDAAYNGAVGGWELLNPRPTSEIAAALLASVPSGVMLDFAGTAIPTGFLGCDGSAVSRTTYAALFAAISTTWGVGDGSTTFNVPDFRRRAAVGSGGTGTGTLGNAVGNTGGAETHTLTVAEMPSHAHPGGTIETDNAGPGAATAIQRANESTSKVNVSKLNMAAQGGGGAHNNMQPSAVVLKIIKT